MNFTINKFFEKDECKSIIDFSIENGVPFSYKPGASWDCRRIYNDELKNKINKIFIWDDYSDLRKSIETIEQHTKGKIKDSHFSFNGHKQFSELLYKKLYTKPTSLNLI